MPHPHPKSLLIAMLSFALFSACPQDPPKETPSGSPQAENHQTKTAQAPPEEISDELAQSRAATKTLMTNLQTTLKSALKSGGPAEGIKACKSAAKPLTEGVAEKSKLQIRRVSTQTRNPENAPDDFELKVLNQLKQMHEEGKLTETTEHHETLTQDGKKVFRYLKPIVIQEACLKCHGQEIQAEVQALLDQHYPQDKATGYKLGDLRGAVSVKIPL